MANDRPPIDAGRIERAARCLSPCEREVLVLSASEKLGLDAVAERLGLSAAEARRLLANALCKLDRALERQQRPWWRFW
ncbi:MAG TPA: sigma factor-like helix-turn-helix DNA-binding protein [Allosphingosinicella sp.]